MSDIVERLRGLADLFEAGDAPRHVVLHMRAGADEIERLRAALREILGWHDYSNDMHKPIEVRAAYMRARAALDYRKMEAAHEKRRRRSAA